MLGQAGNLCYGDALSVKLIQRTQRSRASGADLANRQQRQVSNLAVLRFQFLAENNPVFWAKASVQLVSPMDNKNAYRSIDVGFVQQTDFESGAIEYKDKSRKVIQVNPSFAKGYLSTDWLVGGFQPRTQDETTKKYTKWEFTVDNPRLREWPWYPDFRDKDPANLKVTDLARNSENHWDPASGKSNSATLYFADIPNLTFPGRVADVSSLNIAQVYHLNVAARAKGKLGVDLRPYFLGGPTFSMANVTWQVAFGWPAKTTRVTVSSPTWVVPNRPTQLQVDTLPSLFSRMSPYVQWVTPKK
jgi:hypothetical protein